MSEKVQFNPEKIKDPDDKMEIEFVDFVEKNGFTAKQIEKAYYKFVGIYEKEDKEDEAIDKIATKMNEMADNKFPINRFAELVGAKEDYENSEENYFSYIDSLKISEKEKNVLRSIVEEGRTGELEIFVENESVAEIKVNSKYFPIKVIAITLEGAIGKILKKLPEDKKYGFSFMEE